MNQAKFPAIVSFKFYTANVLNYVLWKPGAPWSFVHGISFIIFHKA